jgi:hypothetical protein
MYYNEADLTLIRPHSDENKQEILPLMALILTVLLDINVLQWGRPHSDENKQEILPLMALILTVLLDINVLQWGRPHSD